MNKVIMGVGIPGSGKTTVLKSFAERNSYTYLCPDDIRAELTGNAGDQSKNSEVWQELYKRVSDAISKGDTVVVDATFARESERKIFIDYVRMHGATKVQGIITDVDLEIANDRNKKRERIVPELAIERMHKLLSEAQPGLKDGFDSIFIIDENQELKSAEMGSEHHIYREFRNK